MSPSALRCGTSSNVVVKSYSYSENAEKKTVLLKHVMYALKSAGRTMYGHQPTIKKRVRRAPGDGAEA